MGVQRRAFARGGTPSAALDKENTMKQGRPLTDLADELRRQADAKRDYLVPARDIAVRTNGATQLIAGGEYRVTDIAHGQIAEYLGIPKAFYDRLRSQPHELTVATVRRDTEPECEPLFDVLVGELLRARDEDRRLVRTLDGQARAFLSESYNTDLDNYDVFAAAAAAVERTGLGPDNVVSCEVTERRLYLKVVSPRLEAVVEPQNVLPGHGYLREPQVVQAGFVVTNSETGLGSLSVQQVVMKLMCTNLWIKEEAYRQRHLGKALEAGEDGAVYKTDTRLADAQARMLKIRDHIAEALDETRFRHLVARMQETTGIRIEGGVEKCVDQTAQRFGLSQSEKESVLRNLIEGADLSLWGLTNAITAAAQHVQSYDRATELEGIGGRFFSLPDAELAQIARAA
jgi:hypothetical protein